MNKENECEIIKDLAIPFMKKEVNSETKNFIENHLKSCDDCRKYYNDIEKEKGISSKNKDIIMINKFKRINSHISILRISLILLILLIVIVLSIFYIRNQKVVNLSNNVYNKIDYLKQLNNYKLTVKTIQKNLKSGQNWEYEQKYYYKDGKSKIEANDSIRFYEDNSYESICVYHEFQTIEYRKQNFIDWKKGNIIDIFSSDVLNYKKMMPTIYSFGLSIREERFSGVDCYVIRSGNNNSYRDIWINKNNFIVIRVINEDYGDFYREELYEFTENTVTDEEVSVEVLDSDKFKNYIKKNIDINENQEIKSYYDLYN